MLSKRFFIIILINLTICSYTGQAQVVLTDQITYSFKGGILLAHRPWMKHLVQKNAWAHEVSVGFANKKGDTAPYFYKNYAHGLSLDFRNFGNNDVLGYGLTVGFFNQFQIMQTGTDLFLDAKINSGVGIITKYYSETDNPKNNAIGSILNAQASLQLILSKHFGHHSIKLGAEFNHFSNGSISTPNLGLNSASLLLGYGYHINKRGINNKPALEPRFDKIHHFNFSLIGSIKEIGEIPFGSKKIPCCRG